MVSSKNFKYKGQASEILDPIIFSDYEIKSLKHGNTLDTSYLDILVKIIIGKTAGLLI